ncbi:MAG: hypothetical protein H7Y41_06960, partial [Hyphomonadaceae bacterium]|nr:hypothetical protein [Clostridia bacterium]
TGVLPLENPGVPSLDPSAAKDVTANFTWFFPTLKDTITQAFPDMKNNIDAYFPIIVIILAFLSYPFIKKETGKKKYILLFLYAQTLFAFVFSFGTYIPFYQYIPLASQLVPGRILTQAAIGATILTAYFGWSQINNGYAYCLKNKQWTKGLCSLLLAVIAGWIIYQSYLIYPKNIVSDYSIEKELYAKLDNQTASFEKGRLAWFGENFGSMNTYFAYDKQYNMVSGWNIEGTSTADYLRYQNVALAYQKDAFLLKNIYDMNVQTCLVNRNNFPWLVKTLEKNGFEKLDSVQSVDILKRKHSSYFLEQPRDAIVIGKASNLFLSDCPWFVKGYSQNPLDYSSEYLNHYKVIYYCEPKIDNLNQLKAFEKQITTLTKSGKAVFIEFGRTMFPSPVLGVTPVSINLAGEYKIGITEKSGKNVQYIHLSGGQLINLSGLEQSLYQIRRDNGELIDDIIGIKKVEKGQVFFIGGPLSQLKGFAFNYLSGRAEQGALVAERDNVLNQITQKLFKNVEMYKNLELPVFNAQDVQWGANSCAFNYQIEKDKRLMVSITYTPRWKVKIDGVDTKVDRVDNMIVFDIPKGTHQVQMQYTMTNVGKIGIGITALSLVLLVIIAFMYQSTIAFSQFSLKGIGRYLELTK